MSETGNGVRRFLGRAEIDKLEDRKLFELFVPEWDAWVHHQQLTALEREYFEDAIYRIELGEANEAGEPERQIDFHASKVRLRLVSLALCDAEGRRLYAEHEMDVLGQRYHQAILTIYNDVAEKNGITKGAAQRAADFSDAGREEPSSSGSRSGSDTPPSGIF